MGTRDRIVRAIIAAAFSSFGLHAVVNAAQVGLGGPGSQAPVSVVQASLQSQGCTDLNVQSAGDYAATSVPPSNFNPLTAADLELRCYGFPARPSAQPELAQWTAEMEAAKQYVVPNLVTDTSGETQNSRRVHTLKRPRVRRHTYDGQSSYGIPWAGYESPRCKNSNHNWSEIGADLPNVAGEYSHDVPFHDVFSWAGFGGDASFLCPGGTSYGSGALTQAGIRLKTDGSYGGQGEIFPFVEWVAPSFGNCDNTPNNHCEPQYSYNVPVSKGDYFYVDIAFQGPQSATLTTYGDSCVPPVYTVCDNSDNTTRAFLENMTTGKFTDVDFAIQKEFSDGTLDWIVEDSAWVSGPSHPHDNLQSCGPSGNQECVYNQTEFYDPYAFRFNTTTDELIDLQNDREYEGVDSSHYWLCPHAVLNDNTWKTGNGTDGATCN